MNAKWLRAREYQVLALILLLAAVHGLLYIFIVPPWQHPDEPMHFEYVWMIINKGKLPVPGEYDWDFRSDLVRSLMEHQFYWNLPTPNPDDLSKVPAGLTYPQLDDPPLYYILASLPVRLMPDSDLADQLIAARQISLPLLLVTIVAAWGTLKEISKPDSIWRFLIPLTIALLPGFVDLMSAVNNDVGAVAVFSLFLWGSVRAVRNGPTLLNVLWVLAAAAAAFFTKSTAFLAVPFAGVVLVLAFLRGGLRRLAWGLVFSGAVLGLLALLYWQEPANWYRTTVQKVPIREAHPDAPVGNHALRLNTGAETTPRWLHPLTQPLPTRVAGSLTSRTLTFGYWIWADPATLPAGGMMVSGPELHIDNEVFSQGAELTGQPRFYTFQAQTPEQVNRIWLSLSPVSRGHSNRPVVYYDGFVLVDGSFPPDIAPDFDDASGERGTWSGIPFNNLLRNPSIEKVWPAFRPQVDNFLAQFIPSNIRPSMILYSLLDLGASGGYYLFTANNVVETFWGKFGWSHVFLPNPEVMYPLLLGLTLLGFLGAVLFPFGQSRSLPVDELLFFGLVFLAVWGSVLARGVVFIFVDHPFIPAARYGFPAIIPTLMLVVAGWVGLVRQITRFIPVPSSVWYGAYLIGFILFDIISLREIVRFYAALT